MLESSPETISLRTALELAYEGEFDGQLSRRNKRNARTLQRRQKRAKRRGREDEFFEELLVAMEGDAHCCQVMPAVATSGDFDQDTPLELSSAGLFELIDGLLERVPAIIEAIKLIMQLFVAFLLCLTLGAGSVHADETSPVVVPEILETTSKTQVAMAKAAKEFWTMPVHKFVKSLPEGGWKRDARLWNPTPATMTPRQEVWVAVFQLRADELVKAGLVKVDEEDDEEVDLDRALVDDVGTESPQQRPFHRLDRLKKAVSELLSAVEEFQATNGG